MERLEIKDTNKLLDVNSALLDESKFVMICMQRAYFDDVNMAGTRILNANLSDLEIDGAQLGGAYIHNIGMPPEGHPMYDPNAKQRPLKFENSTLEGSEITDCNLSNVQISDCNITGMKIDGILVEDLLKSYKS